MGIFPLILGEVRMMGLNSHLYTNYYAHYVLSSTRTYSSLPHVRVHITFIHHEIRGAF